MINTLMLVAIVLALAIGGIATVMCHPDAQ